MNCTTFSIPQKLSCFPSSKYEILTHNASILNPKRFQHFYMRVASLESVSSIMWKIKHESRMRFTTPKIKLASICHRHWLNVGVFCVALMEHMILVTGAHFIIGFVPGDRETSATYIMHSHTYLTAASLTPVFTSCEGKWWEQHFSHFAFLAERSHTHGGFKRLPCVWDLGIAITWQTVQFCLCAPWQRKTANEKIKSGTQYLVYVTRQAGGQRHTCII